MSTSDDDTGARIDPSDPAERLDRILRHLDGFTRVIAHDLKAPIANVSSFAQLLPGTADLGEQGTMMAERMVVNSRRAARIVDAVVDHARRIGRMVDLQPVDLDAVMVAVDESLTDVIDDDVNLEWGEMPPVAGDADELRFVLRHLVDNAIRYRDPERPVHVRVDAQNAGDQVEISVTDDGPGIPEQSWEKAFELGGRLVEVSGPIEGSGVGLATVRVIAENHGGSAFIRPNTGDRGTTVVVTLPVVSGSRAPDQGP